MRHFRFTCAIGLLLQTLPALADTPGVPWFAEVPRSDYYERVSTAQHAALEASFLSLFRERSGDDIAKFFDLQRADWGDHEVLLAASKPDLGWGVWGYNPASEYKLFLQAPHRFFDIDTAVIAEVAWRDNMAQLYMLNSVHRNAGKKQDPRANSDISNARRSALLAASEAWLAVNPAGTIAQLHGFAKSKRSTVQGRQADIILSHGTRERFLPGTRLQEVQACLANLLNVQVLRYPEETGELGGTKNNVASAMRRWGKSEQFIHVEMSRGVRAMLAADPEKAQQALRCIAGAKSA